MKKVIVTTKEQLDSLYKDSALTLEGFNGMSDCGENIDMFLRNIKKLTSFKAKEETVYIIPSQMMNEAYGIIPPFAYDKNKVLISVMLSDLEKPHRLTVARFSFGGRWFDNIVDNHNRRRAAREKTAD